MGALLALHSAMYAGASCNQSVTTGQGCTTAERDADQHASMQWLALRHAVWNQAPRFEFIPGWAAKSTRLRISCAATSWAWASTRLLLMPPRRFPLEASGG